MPKIEIELSEIENLRGQINDLSERLSLKSQELDELKKNTDRVELRAKAIHLAKYTFSKYIETVFSELGFKSSVYGIVNLDSVNFDNTKGNFNDFWYKWDDVKVSVSANVCEDFTQAFLKIGVLRRVGKPHGEKDPLEID